jgi:tight adherence protein B
VTLFLAAVFAIVAVAILLPPSRRNRMKRQLARHVAHHDVRTGRKSSGPRGGVVASVLGATEHVFKRRSFWKRITGMLQGADLPMSAAGFVWLSLGCALVVGLLTAVTSLPKFVSLALAVPAAFIPYLYVRTKMQRRRKVFDDHLPDVLDAIGAILRAGHSFMHALQSIADDYTPPVSTEFRRAVAQIGVGLPVEEALDEMVERVDSADLKYVATCLAVQRQAGGSLSDFFTLVATSVRERQEYARRVRALTAQGRLTAKILLAVPFAVAFLLGSSHWEYMHTLFTTGVGHGIIIVCVILMITGFLVIRRITRLDV